MIQTSGNGSHPCCFTYQNKHLSTIILLELFTGVDLISRLDSVLSHSQDYRSGKQGRVLKFLHSGSPELIMSSVLLTVATLKFGVTSRINQLQYRIVDDNMMNYKRAIITVNDTCKLPSGGTHQHIFDEIKQFWSLVFFFSGAKIYWPMVDWIMKMGETWALMTFTLA